jgi:hypothetical protein
MGNTVKPLISVITPTTGKPSLYRLMESLRKQSVPYIHMLVWDAVRDTAACDPMSYQDEVTHSICLPGELVRGVAAGSALRAVGLMAANTRYVTFADDDVWFDDNHFALLLEAISGRKWAFSVRRIYSPGGELIGVDRFESIGDESELPYDVIDNSSNMFVRELGVDAAQFYRETEQYNDDRLMYAFCKQNGGEPGRTTMPTVNQTCPARLEPFFRQNCADE